MTKIYNTLLFTFPLLFLRYNALVLQSVLSYLGVILSPNKTLSPEM